MMLPRRPARAFLLLAVFLTAGSSLPSLDALVYHTRAAELERWQTHVEAAGECVSHGEHCTLGRTAPGSNAIGALADEPRVAAFTPPAARSFATQHITGTHSTTLARPRAPPVALA
jgi:hypothetical protein